MAREKVFPFGRKRLKTDLLYIRFDERAQDVMNKEVAEGVTLDMGAGETIVGIEILDASRRLDLA